MHSLTLLIPCSLIPSMVGNGVKPIADYEPSMHQNSKNGEFDSIIVSIEPKQKEKNPQKLCNFYGFLVWVTRLELAASTTPIRQLGVNMGKYRVKWGNISRF